MDLFIFCLLAVIIAVRFAFWLKAEWKDSRLERQLNLPPHPNPMSEEEFSALKRGLQADGWSYDPAFYRFTKTGYSDFFSERAPRNWPVEPGENIFFRALKRAQFIAHRYSD